jgi:hypothetical protein
VGSVEYLTDAAMTQSLRRKAGDPQLYHTFLSNAVSACVKDRVVPLPADSAAAAQLLRAREPPPT